MVNNDYFSIVLIDSITGSTGTYATLDCDGVDFSSTFQVADIADIGSRKDAITKTISFKATKNNNIIFGNLSNLNRYVDDSVNLSFFFNFNITQDIDCQVYEGSTLIFVGKLHFISVNRDTSGNITYETSIKGFMVDFFYKINDKLISDLDFSSLSHTFNIENIQKSWYNIYYKDGVQVTGNTSTGYKYAMIDYGANITDDTSFDNKIDYRNFRPALTMTEYFNAIFNQSGLTSDYRYTVTGNTSFMDEFNKLIIPNNDSDFSYTVQPAVIYELSKSTNPQSYNGKNQTFYDNTNKRTEFNHLIAFDTTVTGSTGQSIVNTNVINGQRVVFNNTINTTITASASYTSVQYAGTDVTLSLQCLYRTVDTGQFNNIGQVTKEYKFDESFSIQTNPPFTLNLSVQQQFEAGSEVAFVLYLNGTSVNSFSITVTNADIKIGSPLSTSQVTLNLGDIAVLIGQNTQNIKQVDFLKSVIQVFNLYVFPDPEDSRHIIFMPYNYYYSNFSIGSIRNTALDWTNKIDNNSSFTQTPVSDIFNLYTFTFKDDTDFYSKYYKDKYGNTYGNLTLTGTTNGEDKSIDLIFGSTPVAAYNGRNVPALWELDTDNLKKEKVTVPRLLFYNGLVDCPTYEIGKVTSASTNTYTFSSIDAANVSAYTFSQYAEANEFTISSDNEFIDLSFSVPNEVFYTNGGVLATYGSGKKTLYDRYYANQIKELTDSNTRIIELSAYLNAVDIQNLDFRVPIYFNSILGHNYFKLLSVEYSNQNEPATITLQTAYINDINEVGTGQFYNVTYAEYIQKSNCGSGYTGEALYYVVPADKYFSTVSQADADAMATYEVTVSGQSYSNFYGVCANTGTTFNLGSASYPTDAYNSTGRTSYVTDSGTLNTGSILFSYVDDIPVRNISLYYANDTYYYETDPTSTIVFSGTTASLSATTYDAYFVAGSTQYLSCQTANDGSLSYVNFKISDPTPRVTTKITNSSGGTISNAYYSDGSAAYYVSGGTITSVVSCANKLSIIL